MSRARDYLVIDMPPGLGDATLDVIRFVDGIHFLVVTTHSRVAYEPVRKHLALLKRLQVSVIAVVENMARGPSDYVILIVQEDGVPCLGAIGFDEGLEEAIGDDTRIGATKFYAEVSEIYYKIV